MSAIDLRFPPADRVRFKIQSVGREKAQVAVFIDARDVQDFLDIKDPAWSNRLEQLTDLQPIAWKPSDQHGNQVPAASQSVGCHLTVNGVTRYDVGTGTDFKSAASDALKRAAVLHGIGRGLYSFPQTWLTYGPQGKQLPTNKSGKPYIDARAETKLRSKYADWLRSLDLSAQVAEMPRADAAEGQSIDELRRELAELKKAVAAERHVDVPDLSAGLTPAALASRLADAHLIGHWESLEPAELHQNLLDLLDAASDQDWNLGDILHLAGYDERESAAIAAKARSARPAELQEGQQAA